MFERDIEVYSLIGNFYFKTFYDSLIHLSLVLISLALFVHLPRAFTVVSFSFAWDFLCVLTWRECRKTSSSPPGTYEEFQFWIWAITAELDFLERLGTRNRNVGFECLNTQQQDVETGTRILSCGHVQDRWKDNKYTRLIVLRAQFFASKGLSSWVGPDTAELSFMTKLCAVSHSKCWGKTIVGMWPNHLPPKSSKKKYIYIAENTVEVWLRTYCSVRFWPAGRYIPKKSLTGEERRGEDDVPHPALAADLRVEAARHVSGHAAGQGVHHDGGRVDGAVVVHVEHAEERHDDDACRDARRGQFCGRPLKFSLESSRATSTAHRWREWGTGPRRPARRRAGPCTAGTWRRRCEWSSSRCPLGPGRHSCPPPPRCTCRIWNRCVKCYLHS